MKEIFAPPVRAAAWTLLLAGLLILTLDPPSLNGLDDVIKFVAGTLFVLIVTAWGVVVLSGKEMPEEEFRKLEARSEALARMPYSDTGERSEFDRLVVEALDELPDEFRDVLRDTPVIVSSQGHEHHAYGQYIGGTIARGNHLNRIVIYEDTLTRDFGHDPERLRAEVVRTVRHEIAHHLGWDEEGVRNLGL